MKKEKVAVIQFWGVWLLYLNFPPQFPLGFSAAASVRVGNALGAGNIEQAKLSCKVPIICACKKTTALHEYRKS